MIERYRRWFEYEKESHAKVLASLQALPESLRSAEGFQKATGLLAHIHAARRLWLFRLGVATEAPHELFPRGATLDELAAALDTMEKAWSAYLALLTDADLARRFEYRSTEGPRYRNTVEEILTQLFGHSWYHRGQIASLVRSLGGEPAATDFVFWTRELIPDVSARDPHSGEDCL